MDEHDEQMSQIKRNGVLDNRLHIQQPVPLCPGMKRSDVQQLEAPYSEAKLSAITLATKELQNPTLVIVNSYYKSGASFVGKLFDNHPNSFYLYEPYRLPFIYYKNRKELKNNVTDIFIDSKSGDFRFV